MILVHHEERTLAAAADNDTLEARFDVVLFAILSSFLYYHNTLEPAFI